MSPAVVQSAQKPKAKAEAPWLSDPPFRIWREGDALRITDETPTTGDALRGITTWVGVGGSGVIAVMALVWMQPLLLYGLVLTVPMAVIGFITLLVYYKRSVARRFSALALLDLGDGWWKDGAGQAIAPLDTARLHIEIRPVMTYRGKFLYLFTLVAGDHEALIFETWTTRKAHTLRDELAPRLAGVEETETF